MLECSYSQQMLPLNCQNVINNLSTSLPDIQS